MIEPSLSLIVATVGRTDELDALFASLARQEGIVPTEWEVIVVDQNPPGMIDELCARWAAELPLRHLRSDRHGASVNRNHGLDAARGTVVGFPDDDCTYYPDTLARIRDHFAVRPQGGVLLGQIIDRATGTKIGRRWPQRARRVGSMIAYFFGYTFTIFTTYRKVRFDERLGPPLYFGGFEDVDYLLRCLQVTGGADYDPSVQVWHPHFHLRFAPTAKLAAYGRGFGALCHKHLGPWYLALFATSLVRNAMWMLHPYAAVRRNARASFAAKIAGFHDWPEGGHG